MIEKVSPSILVIDDEASIRNSFRDYLEELKKTKSIREL